jgi:hypothetical protein
VTGIIATINSPNPQNGTKKDKSTVITVVDGKLIHGYLEFL